MPPHRGPGACSTRASAIPPVVVALALLCVAAPGWAQIGVRAPVVIRDTGQETSIVADQIQQVGGPNDLLIAIGNVEITQGASRLLADRVELNRDTGEAIAQGRVVFFDGEDRLVGERVDYNLRTGTGVVYSGSTVSAPYYHLSGERMDRVGDGLYRVRRGVFTTCEGDEPAWSIRMGAATADLNDLVYGTDASFWIKKIPLIPFVPFFAAAIRRERQSGFLFPEYGNSSSKGVYTKVPYYWAISDSQDMTIALDAFSRRGVGVEGEYRYILSQQARGTFTGFLIPELLRDARDRERLDIPEVRGFFSYKHDWQITPRLSFKVDANVTTDDLVFREYGDRLGDRARERAETNVFLTQRWDHWSLTGNVLWYQDLTNPAPVELQRVPEIRLFGTRQPIPGLPGFLYQTEASFTNFYRAIGDGGVRLDIHPRAFLPVPVAGLFTVTPFAGPRITYYNQRAVGEHFNHGITVEDTVHDDHVRLQAEGGFDVETRASRVYQVGGWGGIGALQHLIEPRGTFLMVRGIDQKANPQYDLQIDSQRTFQQFDPHSDRNGRVTQFTYSLTNRLNARTATAPGGEAVRWEAVRVALTQTYDFDRAISKREPFRDMLGEFIFEPSPVLRFRADAAYNMYGLGLRAANTDVTARYREYSLTLGSRYNDISGTNFVVAQAAARVLPNLDARVETNWDIRGDSGVEHRVGIEWRFQCFAITAEYVYRNRSEDEFRFGVNLLGLGQAGTKLGTGL